MKELWVEWVEPFGPGNEPVHMRVPADTAIKIMRNNAARCVGLSATCQKSIYTDEQALEDFVTVHWAKKIEVPNCALHLNNFWHHIIFAAIIVALFVGLDVWMKFTWAGKGIEMVVAAAVHRVLFGGGGS